MSWPTSRLLSFAQGTVVSPTFLDQIQDTIIATKTGTDSVLGLEIDGTGGLSVTPVAGTLTLTGSTGNSTAITATGHGSGNGATLTGGTTGNGLYATNSASGSAAIRAVNSLSSDSNAYESSGPIHFSGASPAYNTAFTNQLGPLNVIKSWVRVYSNTGALTIQDGFNTSTVSYPSALTNGTIKHVFETAMADTNYLAICQVADTTAASIPIAQEIVIGRATNFVEFQLTAAGSVINLNSGTYMISIMVMGRQ